MINYDYAHHNNVLWLIDSEGHELMASTEVANSLMKCLASCNTEEQIDYVLHLHYVWARRNATNKTEK